MIEFFSCTGNDIFIECNSFLTEANKSKISMVATDEGKLYIKIRKSFKTTFKHVSNHNFLKKYLVSLYKSSKIFVHYKTLNFSMLCMPSFVK